MEKGGKERAARVWELAQQDEAYAAMLDQMIAAEARYDGVLQGLNDSQRDAICEYVDLCEDMSRRMLEVACEIL